MKEKIYNSSLELYPNNESDEKIYYNELDVDEFEYLQTVQERYATVQKEPKRVNIREDEAESKDLTARGSKNKHYVKPEQFEQLIKDYYSNDILSDEICDCVYKIANRLSYRPNFVNYTFREEMVGDAIEKMIVALNNKIYKYNPKKIGKNGKKGNAFLYFTKIAENAFINRIKIESRNREAILNYQQDVYYNLVQKGIDINTVSNNNIFE